MEPRQLKYELCCNGDFTHQHVLPPSNAIMAASMNMLLLCALIIFTTISAARPLDRRSLTQLYDSEWKPCKATWYGEPAGDGSDGGACGYGVLSSSPYGNSIAAGSPVMFQDGLGCGACYQVKCTSNALCSGNPVTVTITDLCPGGALCGLGLPHFDLSGFAFSGLAAQENAAAIRGLGVIDVLYKRVPCSYSGQNVALAVDSGSNPSWLAFNVRFQGGPGDLSLVEVKDAVSDWQAMSHLWGTTWAFNKAADLHGALSVRITSGLGNLVLVMDNALPADWSAGNTYDTVANFG